MSESLTFDRMRAAWNNLPVGAKPRTFSAFMHKAIMEKVTEAEKKHNGGKPWPSQRAEPSPPVEGQQDRSVSSAPTSTGLVLT